MSSYYSSHCKLNQIQWKSPTWVLACLWVENIYLDFFVILGSNECSNNLSIEEDGDCTKFQKLDVQTNVQLTPTSVLKENKRAYSGTTTKQQRKKI